MISSDKLCMSCMREIGEAKKCPHCGYYADSTQISPYLPVRTVIANRYMVGKMLEYNGEGATYIGWDLVEKKAIKIREFIPDSFTIRSTSNLTLQIMRGSETVFADLRRSFEEMWTKLARLKGLSALISVNDVVEDFGTSYAIYDHFEGITLRDFLLRSNTGYITWDRAMQLLMPVLSALGTLHSAAIIHRGISPSTLVIGTDGKLKITGFCVGAARTARSDLNSQLYDGYAAIEQYGFDGRQGTWTDIYAFAAVLYRTLIGSDPISAKERMTNDRLMVPGKFAEALPAYVINGLINALQILPDDRTRTVEQLRAELSASPVATAVSGQYQRPAKPAAPVRKPQQPAKAPVVEELSAKPTKAKKSKKRKMSSITLMLLCAAITFVVGISSLTIYLFATSDKKPATNEASTNSATETVNVGNYVGRNFYEVQNISSIKKLTVQKAHGYSSEYSKGMIIAQSLEAGEYPAGTVIVFTISDGVEMIALPDNIVGMHYKEAQERLEEIGFVCKITKVSKGYGSDDAETVVAVSLDENKEYEKGSEVNLRVYIPEGEPVTDENGEQVTNENGTPLYEKPTEEESTEEEEDTTEEETFEEEPSEEETTGESSENE